MSERDLRRVSAGSQNLQGLCKWAEEGTVGLDEEGAKACGVFLGLEYSREGGQALEVGEA
jgi:hypothetical protein